MPSQGSFEAGKAKNKFSKSTEEAEDEIRTAYQAVNFDGKGASLEDMRAYLGLAVRTVRDRLRKMKHEFILEDGMVFKINEHDVHN